MTQPPAPLPASAREALQHARNFAQSYIDGHAQRVFAVNARAEIANANGWKWPDT